MKQFFLNLLKIKLNKRVKILLAAVLLLIFTGANYAFIYTPRNNKITELDQKISTLYDKIEEGNRIAARLSGLRKEFQELTDKMAFIEVLLPKEKDIPAFLVMLQETMDVFHIDFTNFSPQNLLMEKDALYAQLPIRLTFTANYFEMVKFLDRLENFPRIVEVKDLKLNPTGDNQENVNVDMNMVTYVLLKGN